MALHSKLLILIQDLLCNRLPLSGVADCMLGPFPLTTCQKTGRGIEQTPIFGPDLSDNVSLAPLYPYDPPRRCSSSQSSPEWPHYFRQRLRLLADLKSRRFRPSSNSRSQALRLEKNISWFHYKCNRALCGKALWLPWFGLKSSSAAERPSTGQSSMVDCTLSEDLVTGCLSRGSDDTKMETAEVSDCTPK